MPSKKAKKTEMSPVMNLLLGALLLGACYGLASWAIDSGSLWAYLFTFLALYFGVRSIAIYVKEQFSKNDKKRKTS